MLVSFGRRIYVISVRHAIGESSSRPWRRFHISLDSLFRELCIGVALFVTDEASARLKRRNACGSAAAKWIEDDISLETIELNEPPGELDRKRRRMADTLCRF
jgi:hypothetical protein